jgi:hypothetical protein
MGPNHYCCSEQVEGEEFSTLDQHFLAALLLNLPHPQSDHGFPHLDLHLESEHSLGAGYHWEESDPHQQQTH